MFLELTRSPLAETGLDAACAAVVDLLKHLATKGATLASADAHWKHGRKPKTTALEAALALTLAQRRDQLAAVRHDLGFADSFDDPGFSFCFPILEPATREAGKKLLVSMYEEVFRHKKGFQFGEGRWANRTTWEEAFREANERTELCPACASSPLEPPAAGRKLSDADHYLPKATYPALAVHGLNLVPLCKTCNSVLKGVSDPLVDGDTVRSLPDIWFPYKRAGINEIDLTFDPPREPARRVVMIGDPAARERARRFDVIFRLRERWGNSLGGIHQRLPAELLELPSPTTPDGVRTDLRMLRALAELGKASDPRAFVKSQYFAWLENDDIAIEILVEQMQSWPTD